MYDLSDLRRQIHKTCQLDQRHDGVFSSSVQFKDVLEAVESVRIDLLGFILVKRDSS